MADQYPFTQLLDDDGVEALPDQAERRAHSALLWHRDTIRAALYATEITPGLYEHMDQQLHDLLVQQYRQLRPMLHGLCSWPSSDSSQQATTFALALTAVGLLTFGHLEVIAVLCNILTQLPRASLRNRPFSFILGSLRALFPLPKTIDVYTEPESVVAWLQAHRTRIHWDEAENAYRLLPNA